MLAATASAQAPVVQRYVLLPPRSQASISPALLWDKGSYSSWTPGDAEIEGLEKNLPQIATLKIRFYESTPLRIEHPETYLRQYVGVRHNGQRQIYVNAFCDDPPPSDWRSRLYVVVDGATCDWQAFYDPNSETFSDLTINART